MTAAALVEQVLPFVTAARQEARIKPKRLAAANSFDLDETEKAEARLPIEEIKEAHRFELSRREQIQRRAQSYLIAVTVSSSFVVGVVGLESKVASFAGLSWVSKGALLAALGYFLISALSALRIIGHAEIYEFSLQQRAAEFGPDVKAGKYVKYIRLNQGIVLVHAAWARACAISMRNALLILSILLVVLVVSGPAALSKSYESPISTSAAHRETLDARRAPDSHRTATLEADGGPVGSGPLQSLH